MTLYAYRTADRTLWVADDHGHGIACSDISEMDRTLADLHGEQLPACTIYGRSPDGRSAGRP